MRDYENYTLTDFMLDEDFIRWVQEQRPTDQSFWEDWLHTYPGKKLLVAEARRILQSINIHQKDIGREEVQEETQKLLKAIGAAPAMASSPRSTLPFLHHWWPAAAV